MTVIMSHNESLSLDLHCQVLELCKKGFANKLDWICKMICILKNFYEIWINLYLFTPFYTFQIV